jgi:ribosomal protein L37E
MSLAEFFDLIKDELGCYRLIRYFKFPNHHFKCSRCGSENEKPQATFNLRKTKCADCFHSESLTAKTIFHGSRKPLTLLIPIVLSVVIGEGQSASEVSRKKDTWYNTVWNWHRKAREYFSLFISPDDTQPVHHSFLLDVLFRRTTESAPVGPSPPSTKPDDTEDSVEVEIEQEVEIQTPEDCRTEVVDSECETSIMQDPNDQELVLANNDSVIDEIPQPDDWLGVRHTIKHIEKLFRSGVGLKHAPGYTAQCNYITHFKGNVQNFLAACIRAAPQRQPRSDFLTLPRLNRKSGSPSLRLRYGLRQR